MDINAQPQIFGGIQSTFHAGIDENPQVTITRVSFKHPIPRRSQGTRMKWPKVLVVDGKNITSTKFGGDYDDYGLLFMGNFSDFLTQIQRIWWVVSTLSTQLNQQDDDPKVCLKMIIFHW